MKIAVRALASLLLCAATFPACANPMQPAETSPTASELAQWKKDVLDRYKQVAYLNAENLPISESEFLAAVRGGRSPFSMTVAPDSPDRMTVRLLRPDEAAQAAAKPAP
jgi:hypothetical protein